ncbi:MAG TPA: hypothetical protein ENK07_01915 [Bacteroidetes bacterium]|nr:hypothetical protein [Bacteroidota bacterium]
MAQLRLLLPAVVLTLSITGCVEYQQRVTLQPDGSGAVEVRVEAPKDVNWETEGGLRIPRGTEEEICAEIRDRYDTPHVRVQSCRVRVVGDRRTTEFVLGFDQLSALNGLDLLGSRGRFQLRRDDGLEVRHTIDIEGDPDWEEAESRFEKWVKERLSDDIFSKIRFRYEIVFPERVEETNASWVRGGRVAVWRYTLADLMGRDRVVQYARGR